MSKMVKLCTLEDLPERGARGFDPEQWGHDTVFVVRRGRFVYAYRDLCPHYGNTALPWRKDAYLDTKGEAIVCAAHGARFEIATGLCTSGPCLGKSLVQIPLRVSNGGDVLATLDTNNNGAESP
ncbi:Rieske (2Fe-2S) protein [Microbulbifer rhizosphaerae]|uniref:Nitrite reductase/ring-hydroxylating ferredoxin subunit n=1 Tax=Microbulbifer rhizosphaerae TaxID=1562603 RepID=A0A7W4W8J0_9GAMM|nr:Rieske (2Fe-2S) protein [Microbulbifer rhizosphaerae]MBB3059685.1 nitrite reductase/ring-hydroxylating ferredoxin subunit [Microbulbifer rhizosphaerae]